MIPDLVMIPDIHYAIIMAKIIHSVIAMSTAFGGKCKLESCIFLSLQMIMLLNLYY